MSKESFPVLFKWKADVSRKLPESGKYSTLCRIAGSNEPWPDIGWSFEVTFTSEPSVEGGAKGVGTFLVPQAPNHLIQKGTIIELYEGRKISATAEVL